MALAVARGRRKVLGERAIRSRITTVPSRVCGPSRDLQATRQARFSFCYLRHWRCFQQQSWPHRARDESSRTRLLRGRGTSCPRWRTTPERSKCDCSSPCSMRRPSTTPWWVPPAECDFWSPSRPSPTRRRARGPPSHQPILMAKARFPRLVFRAQPSSKPGSGRHRPLRIRPPTRARWRLRRVRPFRKFPSLFQHLPWPDERGPVWWLGHCWSPVPWPTHG